MSRQISKTLTLASSCLRRARIAVNTPHRRRWQPSRKGVQTLNITGVLRHASAAEACRGGTRYGRRPRARDDYYQASAGRRRKYCFFVLRDSAALTPDRVRCEGLVDVNRISAGFSASLPGCFTIQLRVLRWIGGCDFAGHHFQACVGR